MTDSWNTIAAAALQNAIRHLAPQLGEETAETLRAQAASLSSAPDSEPNKIAMRFLGGALKRLAQSDWPGALIYLMSAVRELPVGDLSTPAHLEILYALLISDKSDRTALRAVRATHELMRAFIDHALDRPALSQAGSHLDEALRRLDEDHPHWRWDPRLAVAWTSSVTSALMQVVVMIETGAPTSLLELHNVPLASRKLEVG